MKKRKDSPSAIYLRNHPYVSLSILILIVIFFVWAFSVKHFDPEKDVCEQWKCLGDNKDYGRSYNENGVNIPWDKKTCEEFQLQWTCKEWRSKTKCEINPEDVGCICDTPISFEKFNTSTFYNYTVFREFKLTGENCMGECTNEEVCHTNGYCFLKSQCIKSHEPNECEKENLNYVIDSNMPCVCRDDSSTGDRVQVGSNETQLCTKVDCSMNCRKKTIQDFSCAELKKAVILNKRFVVCDTAVYKVYFTSEKFIMNCWTTWISTEDIYDVAINKGCDV